MNVDQELAVVQKRLQELGCRWTNQRALIVRSALARHDHYTAEELLRICQETDPHVSRATVYRTLRVLEQAGFVEGLETGEGSRKFEHVLGHEHHDHMVCTSCGTILEFRDEELEARQEVAAQKAQFEIHHHSLRLYGLCRNCRSRGRGNRR
jgi:Fur family ferric uptake transcriptional regulator